MNPHTIRELLHLTEEIKVMDEQLLTQLQLIEKHLQQSEFEVGAEVSMPNGGALSWSKSEDGKWTFGIRTQTNPQLRITLEKSTRALRVAAAHSLENLLNVMLQASRSLQTEMVYAKASLKNNLDVIEKILPSPKTEEVVEDDTPY